MLIANPIYDIVFKKLMENREIARGVLERILGTQVDQLDFAAQEFTAEAEDGSLKFYRLDFKARIMTPDGWKHVLIELQKARLSSDVERFRTYLAEEYRRVCEVAQPSGEHPHRNNSIIAGHRYGVNGYEHVSCVGLSIACERPTQETLFYKICYFGIRKLLCSQ